jgi:tRNA threonylcarbamoyladenosine biosynthesis protein TsaE
VTAIVTTGSPEATRACGAAAASLLRAGDVLLLCGDLGAGKTQLTKGIAEGLGVADPVTSPTFNILLVHEGRLPLYHFDLYRLDRAEQLEDVDYWGTLEADGVSVVEWGDRFPDALPVQGVVVRMLITGDETRAIEVVAMGQRGSELAAAWLDAMHDVPGTGRPAIGGAS